MGRVVFILGIWRTSALSPTDRGPDRGAQSNRAPFMQLGVRNSLPKLLFLLTQGLSAFLSAAAGAA